jgi:outer membrane protein OmpA-like peptidoglycan-associated protein
MRSSSRVAFVGWCVALALAAAPAFGGEPEIEESCVGKVRLRGPIWDLTANQLEPGLDVVLDDVARVYKERCVGKLVVIEAHAYALPAPELNEKLSELRAAVIRHELVKRGVPATELVLAPMGDRRPMFPLDGPDAAERNRRITFRVAN